MEPEEERLAVFLDYENLALGARDHLGGLAFTFRPIADALAERGRVVVRRAYADWSYFDDDRRMLTRSHVELIEIPQRMGAIRKNAADIKMAVDAVEMAFERDYISTFVICTGDSDFTPLVYKLRELNKRVIGVGVEKSTSRLLPPACDEFLYFDRLEGIDDAGAVDDSRVSGRRSGTGRVPSGARPSVEGADKPSGGTETKSDRRPSDVEVAVDDTGLDDAGHGGTAESADEVEGSAPASVDELAIWVAQTIAGLQRTTSGQVYSSTLKRTLLRKDPTFSEADYGFRAFGELLRHLAERNVVELTMGPAKGDPEISLPEHGDQEEAFALLASVLAEADPNPVAMSGLKDRLRKKRGEFGEDKLGYRSFLQFCRAAVARGAATLVWDDAAGDYQVTVGPGREN